MNSIIYFYSYILPLSISGLLFLNADVMFEHKHNLIVQLSEYTSNPEDEINHLWNRGVAHLHEQDFESAREYYMQAAGIAHNEGMNLHESFSHQYVAMAAAVLGKESIMQEHLERSQAVSQGEDMLEDFHDLTVAIAYASMDWQEEAQNAVDRVSLVDSDVNSAAIHVTRGVVAAANGDFKSAEKEIEKLENAAGYQILIKSYMSATLLQQGDIERAEILRDEILDLKEGSYWDALARLVVKQ